MKGIRMEGKPFTRQFVEELRRIEDYRIEGYLSVISSLNQQINAVSNRIRKEAIEDESTRLLMTIPGVGYYSALLILSEIGEVDRFPDAHHLCSYAGLTPSTRSSGGVTHHGAITRSGSRYLRWIMVECAKAHIRTQKDNSELTRFYRELAKRRGSSKAIVASASKLLRIVYCVLKEKRAYMMVKRKDVRGSLEHE